MATSEFYLPGMDCPVEEKLVRSRLKSVPGIHALAFNLLERKLKVSHEAGALNAIASALAGLNMGATLLGQNEKPLPQTTVIPWQRLFWALGLAAISEAVELYGAWHASQPLPWEIASLLFAIAAIWLCGLATYKKGWLAVRYLNLNINALMAVAVTGAVLIGQWPEAAMVMVLFNVSEAIESRALLHARDAISELVNLAPHLAEVRQPDGSWSEVHAHDVPPGTHVRVLPGAKIPLDGRVISGASNVNQAPITGESMPVPKKPGDFVYAGTLNENGNLEFESTATSHDTTLARIIHSVQEAQATRAPMQRFIDSFASWYTPAIFILALICSLAPPLLWGSFWLSSIYTGLVILVIGCPCALVISTPVTIVSGMAAATRRGMVIKGGIFLEQGRLLKCIAFDKTGTITQGQPKVTDFVALGSNQMQARQICASLVALSDHPVANAIRAFLANDPPASMPVEDFKAIAGKGITASIGGTSWSLGNANLADMHLSEDLREQIHTLEAQGKTVSLLYENGRPAALFAVADTLRPASIATISKLKAMRIIPVMLTGDNARAATAIASEAGIAEVRAGLLPDQKLDAIEELKKRYGMTGMVGDGINDAPALAAANISFAMAKEGTDTAIETADVALMEDNPERIPAFIQLSRSVFAILIENIGFALTIKAFFFALALAGLATMWMAVFADVGAALLVTANGMRALRK